MTVTIAAELPALRVDQTGTIRVGETRVTLDTLVGVHRQGMTPSDIVDCFPGLALSDVYSAIAYYLRHQSELDEYLAERDRQAEEIRREIEADPKHQAFRKTLLERIKARRARP